MHGGLRPRLQDDHEVELNSEVLTSCNRSQQGFTSAQLISHTENVKKLNIRDVCSHDCKGSSRCLRWIVWPMRTLAGLLLQTLWHFMARQALSGCRAAGSSNSKDINIGRRPILRSAFRRPSTAQARQADPPYLVASQPDSPRHPLRARWRRNGCPQGSSCLFSIHFTHALLAGSLEDDVSMSKLGCTQTSGLADRTECWKFHSKRLREHW